ncbi:hypothetical protein [Sphingomonas sp. LHG3406-1]|uniref:hypothetical protein n=1 Tax=Sphingomonas sp. LHG3406-1 TaxID=2804617 RepID=UPI0026396553|nr:hypothetical protein [Sphingomonas sp. LHG3406-1]
MGITGGGKQPLMERRERKNGFGLQRQKTFLTSFATTGNIGMSAREANVAPSTIWLRRQTDLVFRKAFNEAQDSAVANLRAELVRRGLELLNAATAVEAAPAVLAGMDAKLLLALIVHHERSLGRDPGDIRPRRSDASEAAERLHALMKRMREERKRDLAAKRKRKQG